VVAAAAMAVVGQVLYLASLSQQEAVTVDNMAVEVRVAVLAVEEGTVVGSLYLQYPVVLELVGHRDRGTVDLVGRVELVEV
jgi:hypothetical protein